MSAVDVTERLDEIEQLIVRWDFPGARDAVQGLLDEDGLSDDDRLTARRLLAEVLRELGDLDGAYDLAEVVAAQAERRHGPTHAETLLAIAVLAAVRHDYDEWDEAERLYHRVLDAPAEPGDDAPLARAIRLTRVNLALLQRDRGDTALALSMLSAAYAVHRREYGAEDLDTIRIAAELAALQHAAGNVPAARRLFTLAHAAARSRLGTRHPFTRAVEWELAAVEPPMPSAPVSGPLPPMSVLAPDEGPDASAAPAAAAPRGPVPAQRGAARPVSAVPVSPEPYDAGPYPAEPYDAEPSAAEPVFFDPRPQLELVEPPTGTPRASRPRWPVLAVVVLLLAGAAAAGLVLWARGRSPGPTPAPPVTAASVPPSTASSASAAAAPPSVPPSTPASDPGARTVRGLRLQDGGNRLTVTWQPLNVPVVVALARGDSPPAVLTTLPARAERYVVTNVDPRAAYCVVVGPVDEGAAVTPATSVCTGSR